MNIDPHQPLQDIATKIPGSIPVLDKLGIDYCHQGFEPLADACLRRGLTLDEVLTLLEEGRRAAGEPEEYGHWAARPLEELISHIVSRHHAFNRREFARLEELFAQILATEGRRPEWKLLHALFDALDRKISSHMDLEEQTVFPYISELEREAKRGASPHPSRRKSIQRPIRMMMLEHDSAAELIKRMRLITSDFTPPPGSSADYRDLYAGLKALAEDLHCHFFLENNILFPQAVSLESPRERICQKGKPE
jgi:regulator of cell morphogenesis and NO signaling